MATVHVTAPTRDNPLAAYVHRVYSRDAADIDETLASLDEAAPVVQAGATVLALLDHYDLGPPRHVWAEGLGQTMLDVAVAGARAVERGAGRSVPMQTAVDDYAATVAESMARTAADRLSGTFYVVRQSAGATVADLRRALATGLTDPGKVVRRASLAAGNALHAAYNIGAFTVVQATDLFRSKTWNHDGDPVEPRDWHEEMDGETVDVDEPFSNGLMFPHDPDGDPEETYNCTCSVTYST